MEIINRKQYVDRVLGYLGKGLILVLTGQRRVGKSCILQSVAKQITAKDDSANVIYINKEYAEFNSLKTDEDLNEYVAAHLKDQRHNYLFVDEVQDIDGFENALRNFQAKDLCDIVVTGSNAINYTITALTRSQLSKITSRTNQQSTLTRTQLDVVDHCTYRDVCQRKTVTNLRSSFCT